MTVHVTTSPNERSEHCCGYTFYHHDSSSEANRPKPGAAYQKKERSEFLSKIYFW
ncbi:MAG: hypothetical protein ACI81P_000049 [Neolewinella sp.]